MKRIAIVGLSCSGKTTFACELAVHGLGPAVGGDPFEGLCDYMISSRILSEGTAFSQLAKASVVTHV